MLDDEAVRDAQVAEPGCVQRLQAVVLGGPPDEQRQQTEVEAAWVDGGGGVWIDGAQATEPSTAIDDVEVVNVG